MELIRIENETALLNIEVNRKIADFERQIKSIKEQEDELKKAILEEMENKNLFKVETDDLTINYIAPTDRETFDSKKFREENPNLYDEYIKMSPVKSSIRIKVK